MVKVNIKVGYCIFSKWTTLEFLLAKKRRVILVFIDYGVFFYMCLMSIILEIGIQRPPFRQINLLPVAQMVV